MEDEVEYMGKKIVCIGDSITEGIGDEKAIGWPGRLAIKLAKTYPDEEWIINNLGISGNTLSDIYMRLNTEVTIRQPDILIIGAGVNDTAFRLWPETSEPKTSFTYRKEIWTKIYDFITLSGIETFVLSLLPVNEDKFPLIYMPYDEKDHGITIKQTMVDEWNIFLIEHCNNNGNYNIIKLHSSCKNILPHLPDGLHPNAQGYDMITEYVFEALRPCLRSN